MSDPIKIIVGVTVMSDGKYSIVGGSVWESKESMAEWLLEHRIGDSYHILTAEVPRPEPRKVSKVSLSPAEAQEVRP